MWLKSIWVNTCYLISFRPSCQWIQPERFDERFLLPSSSLLPLQVSPHCHTVIHCSSIGLSRCFSPVAVAVWTMFACRAYWQRCGGPLARLSINRAHLYRDGEDRLICLVKFCLYLLVISFAVYLLCFGLRDLLICYFTHFDFSLQWKCVWADLYHNVHLFGPMTCCLGLRGHEGQVEPIGTSHFFLNGFWDNCQVLLPVRGYTPPTTTNTCSPCYLQGTQCTHLKPQPGTKHKNVAILGTANLQ